MKIQASKLLLCTSVCMTICGISVAGNINTTNVSSPYNECVASESVDRTFYIQGNSYNRPNTRDTFGNTNSDSRILTDGSKVEIWRNNGVLTACDDWSRISNVVKKSSYDRVLAFLNNNGCNFNKPTYSKYNNPTAIDAQIHFIVGYYQATSKGGSTLKTHYGYKDFEDAYWTCYPGGEQKNNISQCPETTFRYDTSLKLHKGECMNYRLFWCGDGLVNGRDKNGTTITSYDNGTSSEACDPNDPNHKGWEAGTNKRCNNKCQLEDIPQPVCTPQESIEQKVKDFVNEGGDLSKRHENEYKTGNFCTQGEPKDFTNDTTAKKWKWNCKLGSITTDSMCEMDYTVPEPECKPEKDIPQKIKDYINQGNDLNNRGTFNKGLTIADFCNTDSTGISKFTEDKTQHKWTWTCKNGDKPSSTCSITYPYCGDGIQQQNEECDDGLNNGKEGSTCSTDCKTVNPPEEPICGDGYVDQGEACDDGKDNGTERSKCKIDCTYKNPECSSDYDGQRFDSLTKKPELCKVGDVSDFKENDNGWTWKCGGIPGKKDAPCEAYKNKYGTPTYTINKSHVSTTWNDDDDQQQWIVVWKISGSSSNISEDTITLKDTLPVGYQYDKHDDSSVTYLGDNKFKVNSNQTFNFNVTTLTDTLSRKKENNTNKVCIDNVTNKCDTDYGPYLTIVKSAKPQKVSAAGDKITWTIQVTAHERAITNFNIMDDLPNVLSIDENNISIDQGLTVEHVGGVFKVTGTLGANKEATLTIPTTLNSIDDLTDIQNIACIAGTKDEYGLNICDDTTVTTDFQPDLELHKYILSGDEQRPSYSMRSYKPGETVKYKIVYLNKGNADAKNRVITDTIPPVIESFDFGSTPAGVSCEKKSSSTFSCTIPEIQKGTTGEIYFDAKIKDFAELYKMENPHNKTTNTVVLTKNGVQEASAWVNFNLLMPKIKIEKTIEDEKSAYETDDKLVFKITVTNEGDVEIPEGFNVIDYLPKGYEFSKILESKGYPKGEIEVKDKIDGELIKFSDSGKTLPSNVTGEVKGTDIMLKIKEGMDIGNIKLKFCGNLPLDQIDSVKLGEVTAPVADILEFNYDNGNEGVRSFTYFDKETTLPLYVTFKEGNKENQNLCLQLESIESRREVELDKTPMNINFENETVSFKIGGEREIPNTATGTDIDILNFKVFSNYNVEKVTLSLTGDLPLANIAKIKLGDTTLDKIDDPNKITFAYTNKTILDNGDWNLNVVFTGDIEPDKTLAFMIEKIDGGRDLKIENKQTTTLKFKENPETVSFSDKEKNKKYSVDGSNQKTINIDNMNFMLNKSLTITGLVLTLETNGSDTNIINKIESLTLSGFKLNPGENNTWKLAQDVMVDSGTKMPLEIKFNEQVNTGTTIKFKLKGLSPKRRINTDDITTATVEFVEVEPDVLKFEGEGSFGTGGTGTSSMEIDTLRGDFQIQHTFTKLVLRKTGNLNPASIENIFLDHQKFTKERNDRYVLENSEGIRVTGPLMVTFTGTINSGDMLGFMVEEIADPANITTGTESKVITFIPGEGTPKVILEIKHEGFIRESSFIADNLYFQVENTLGSTPKIKTITVQPTTKQVDVLNQNTQFKPDMIKNLKIQRGDYSNDTFLGKLNNDGKYIFDFGTDGVDLSKMFILYGELNTGKVLNGQKVQFEIVDFTLAKQNINIEREKPNEAVTTQLTYEKPEEDKTMEISAVNGQNRYYFDTATGTVKRIVSVPGGQKFTIDKMNITADKDFNKMWINGTVMSCAEKICQFQDGKTISVQSGTVLAVTVEIDESKFKGENEINLTINPTEVVDNKGNKVNVTVNEKTLTLQYQHPKVTVAGEKGSGSIDKDNTLNFGTITFNLEGINGSAMVKNLEFKPIGFTGVDLKLVKGTQSYAIQNFTLTGLKLDESQNWTLKGTIKPNVSISEGEEIGFTLTGFQVTQDNKTIEGDIQQDQTKKITLSEKRISINGNGESKTINQKDVEKNGVLLDTLKVTLSGINEVTLDSITFKILSGSEYIKSLGIKENSTENTKGTITINPNNMTFVKGKNNEIPLTIFFNEKEIPNGTTFNLQIAKYTINNENVNTSFGDNVNTLIYQNPELKLKGPMLDKAMLNKEEQLLTSSTGIPLGGFDVSLTGEKEVTITGIKWNTNDYNGSGIQLDIDKVNKGYIYAHVQTTCEEKVCEFNDIELKVKDGDKLEIKAEIPKTRRDENIDIQFSIDSVTTEQGDIWKKVENMNDTYYAGYRKKMLERRIKDVYTVGYKKVEIETTGDYLLETFAIRPSTEGNIKGFRFTLSGAQEEYKGFYVTDGKGNQYTGTIHKEQGKQNYLMEFDKDNRIHFNPGVIGSEESIDFRINLQQPRTAREKFQLIVTDMITTDDDIVRDTEEKKGDTIILKYPEVIASITNPSIEGRTIKGTFSLTGSDIDGKDEKEITVAMSGVTNGKLMKQQNSNITTTVNAKEGNFTMTVKYLGDYTFEGQCSETLKAGEECTVEIVSVKAEEDSHIHTSIKNDAKKISVTIPTPENTASNENSEGHDSASSNIQKSDYYFNSADFNKETNEIRWWDLNQPLPKNYTLELRVEVIVKDGGTNKACYRFDNEKDIACAEKKITVEKSDVTCVAPKFNGDRNNQNKWSGTVTCDTKGEGKAKVITINKGDTSVATQKKQTSLTKSFTNITSPTDFACIVESQKNTTCTGVLEKEPPELGVCGNGIAEDWEECDCTESSFPNDIKHDCKISKADVKGTEKHSDKDYSCHNCKIYDENEDRIAPEPVCFNVNAGSISINPGEILPFYWNVEKINKNYYTTIDSMGNAKNAIENYEEYEGEACDENDYAHVALDTMKCTYKIYHGKKEQSENERVMEFTVPCFTKGTEGDTNWNEELLLKAFEEWNRSTYFPDGNSEGDTFAFKIDENDNVTFRSSRSYIEKFGTKDAKLGFKKAQTEDVRKLGKELEVFGEYKLSLDHIDYLVCAKKSKGYVWSGVEGGARVCENDFSFTKPYITQISPSGIGMSNVFNNFYDLDGDRLWDKATNDVNIVKAENYETNTGVTKEFDDYITKIKKTALPATTKVKKISGKQIYFVEENVTLSGYFKETNDGKDRVTKLDGNDLKLNQPFTIVSENDITIRGSVDHNMMILTNGKIIFDMADTGCDRSQEVRGIFYAAQGFERINVRKNDDLNHDTRCIGGGLHVRGILIGSGLDDVANAGRSNLNEWFTSESGKEDQTHRKYVTSGASLLIEYNPDKYREIPGAEAFTSVLNMYKI